MAASDPGPLGFRWTDWPTDFRVSGAEITAESLSRMQLRGNALRCRPIGGDTMSVIPMTMGTAGTWTDQGTASRIYLPPWAAMLVMIVKCKITGGPAYDYVYKGWFRAKFGSTPDYSNAVSVWLGATDGSWVDDKGFEHQGYGGLLDDCDGSPAQTAVWFTKRITFAVPVGLRGTEQSFQYQFKRDDTGVTAASLTNSGTNKSSWYFVAVEEA